MARIAVYGGTFDPPHRGHLAVATAALEAHLVDRVLITPTGQQPLKSAAPAASYADRCAMVARLVQQRQGLELCRADAPHPDGSPNYTADLIRQLRADATPEDTFLLLAGCDSFRTLPSWHAAAFLAQHVEWIVASRPGEDLRSVIETVQAHFGIPDARIHTLPNVDVPISATDLRSRLAAGDPCVDALPAAVSAYIREHNLYRLA